MKTKRIDIELSCFLPLSIVVTTNDMLFSVGYSQITKKYNFVSREDIICQKCYGNEPQHESTKPLVIQKSSGKYCTCSILILLQKQLTINNQQ